MGLFTFLKRSWSIISASWSHATNPQKILKEIRNPETADSIETCLNQMIDHLEGPGGPFNSVVTPKHPSGKTTEEG